MWPNPQFPTMENVIFCAVLYPQNFEEIELNFPKL